MENYITFDAIIIGSFMQDNNMKLEMSRQLTKLMRDKQISQSALSRATGVPQPTINRILSEVTREPRRDSVLRIANYFGVTPESMYAVPSKREQAESESAHSIEELFGRIAGLNKIDRDQLLRKISENLR
jgi:transcriptional regulator with XRE-family HTH domain